MKRAEILDAVREIVRRDLACERPVREDADLLGDLELDSLQRLTLSVELENRFAICFEPEDELHLETVGDVLDLIERCLGGAEEGDPGVREG